MGLLEKIWEKASCLVVCALLAFNVLVALWALLVFLGYFTTGYNGQFDKLPETPSMIGFGPEKKINSVNEKF